MRLYFTYLNTSRSGAFVLIIVQAISYRYLHLTIIVSVNVRFQHQHKTFRKHNAHTTRTQNNLASLFSGNVCVFLSQRYEDMGVDTSTTLSKRKHVTQLAPVAGRACKLIALCGAFFIDSIL